MLEIKDLIVSYGRRSILKNIRLELEYGEKVAIIGPNGSGKSTLIKAVLGIAPISGGYVKIFNFDVKNLKNELRVSANLPELYRLFNANIKDLFKVFSMLKEVDEAAYFNLCNYFDLDDILDKRMHELSAGQVKMFANIMALAPNPKLLLLDEPFENVDQTKRIKLIRILQNFKESIILVTHELEILRKFPEWNLYFVLEGQLYGPFKVSDMDDLYLSKGIKENALMTIQTSIGIFSITKEIGEVALKYATNFNQVIEEVA
ncbi:MAG TPA: ATP-binding cassette domain-containing protein [Geobacterales bacterium]|nr:ATP-binding cassette domain-containing protein [Geobacterales bacterium]